MPATMSVRGLYSWDDTLFESMQVPAAFTEDDKQMLVDNILIETADFECVYTSPEFLAVAIDRWSRKELPTWERIYRVATMSYNPLENYNRTETSTETTENTQQHSGTDASAHTGTDTETHSGTDTETHSGTDTETNSGTDQVASNSTTTLDGTDTETHSGTDTTNIKKAAFDTNTLVDTESTATVNGHTITRDMDDTTTVTGTGSTTYGHKVDTKHGEAIATQHGKAIATQHGETITDTYGHKVDDSGEVTRESHISGNIGVTTSQQMAEAEILVSAKLNVYNYIIESFKNRFCLLVF